MLVLDTTESKTYEAVVSITNEDIVSWEQVPGI